MQASGATPGLDRGCAFCTRSHDPVLLFETPSLYVTPDQFPICPGHILFVTTRHYPCFAAVPRGAIAELDAALGRVRAFLEHAYPGPVLVGENGVAGQSVHHAHLHVLPVPVAEMPIAITRHTDVARVSGWQEVRDHYFRHGTYRYFEFGDEKWLLPGYSPALDAMRDQWSRWFGVRWGPDGVTKTTTPEDVAELMRRWDRLRPHVPPPEVTFAPG